MKKIKFQLMIIAGFMLSGNVLAETITIGKGRGIVYTGFPYNITLSGRLYHSNLGATLGLASFSTQTDRCMSETALRTIAGVKVFPLNADVGIIPRAKFIATYQRADNSNETLTGTIGLPETKGLANGNVITNPVSNREWCLPPRMLSVAGFYNASADRTSSVQGDWAMVASGNQKPAQLTIPILYYGSYAASPGGDKFTQAFPQSVILRISTLECTVNTQTSINFGNVARDVKEGSELAAQTQPMVTHCTQVSDFVNANVNVQFEALSGNYNGDPSKLALREGGGYITGEIDNGVTGSGMCNASTGLTFNDRQYKVGDIKTSDRSKSYTNQITWRLCSGGASLPTGPVSAAAELRVTFN